MNNKVSLSASLSTLALLAAFGSTVHAAPAPQPEHWIPAGQGIADATAAPSTASQTTRAAVKAETLAAMHNGTIVPIGRAASLGVPLGSE